MDPSWKERLSGEFKKEYFQRLVDYVREERKRAMIFPAASDVFNAFKLTPFDKVRVVILGQDPYINAGQAHGLSFSVPPNMKPPPSLKNIFQEMHDDLGVPVPKTGCLVPWAEQGVFLLNSTLTVRAHESGSHQYKGWEAFTDEVIKLLSGREEPVVFVLWGRYAGEKKSLIDGRHTIIEAPHPSPMSASQGFFGSKPFSKINAALAGYGGSPIDWSL